MDLRGFIRDIPDFPKPGIVFKDITPLFLDARALEHAVALLARYAEELEVDYVVSAEARGFVLGGAIAAEAGAEVAGCAFVIELAFLKGRERLAGRDVRSLVVYEEE